MDENLDQTQPPTGVDPSAPTGQMPGPVVSPLPDPNQSPIPSPTDVPKPNEVSESDLTHELTLDQNDTNVSDVIKAIEKYKMHRNPNKDYKYLFDDILMKWFTTHESNDEKFNFASYRNWLVSQDFDEYKNDEEFAKWCLRDGNGKLIRDRYELVILGKAPTPAPPIPESIPEPDESNESTESNEITEQEIRDAMKADDAEESAPISEDDITTALNTPSSPKSTTPAPPDDSAILQDIDAKAGAEKNAIGEDDIRTAMSKHPKSDGSKSKNSESHVSSDDILNALKR